MNDDALRALARRSSRGVAVVAITLAAAGAAAVTDDDARLAGVGRRRASCRAGRGARAHRAAAAARRPRQCRGAGDAFCAGLLAGLLWSEPLTLADTGHRGLESARERVDSAARGGRR